MTVVVETGWISETDDQLVDLGMDDLDSLDGRQLRLELRRPMTVPLDQLGQTSPAERPQGRPHHDGPSPAGGLGRPIGSDTAGLPNVSKGR